MALLTQAVNVEFCMRVVALPPVDPVLDEQGSVTNQVQIDADLSAKAEAQSVIDAASPEVMALVAERNPPND